MHFRNKSGHPRTMFALHMAWISAVNSFKWLQNKGRIYGEIWLFLLNSSVCQTNLSIKVDKPSKIWSNPTCFWIQYENSDQHLRTFRHFVVVVVSFIQRKQTDLILAFVFKVPFLFFGSEI